MGAIEGSRTGVILRKVGAAAWRNPSVWKEVAEGLLALVDTESKMAESALSSLVHGGEAEN